jgi:radical SAM superfamily enzyme
VFTLEDYIETVAHCVELLPKDITIHRLTGDGPKKILIEPTWSGNKRMVLNTMNKYLREHDVEQGKRG